MSAGAEGVNRRWGGRVNTPMPADDASPVPSHPGWELGDVGVHAVLRVEQVGHVASLLEAPEQRFLIAFGRGHAGEDRGGQLLWVTDEDEAVTPVPHRDECGHLHCLHGGAIATA